STVTIFSLWYYAQPSPELILSDFRRDSNNATETDMNINRDLFAVRRKLYELAQFRTAPTADRIAAAEVLLNDCAWNYARAAVATQDQTHAKRCWRNASRCYGAAGMLARHPSPAHILIVAADRLTKHARRPQGEMP
ncbi:hypothetical protein, partial [Rhodanobacter lindaniclasticus]